MTTTGMDAVPLLKDVVLVGGGHSHVLLMRMWAMQPLPGVRLTLVSEKVNTPYSGMLPGLIAGHYSEEEVHVDLARLCSWANVRFIERRVVRLDLEARLVHVNDDRPPIEFDVLSLDTGSTPELSVSGADQFSVPVKPVYGFYQRWRSILERIAKRTEQTSSKQAVSLGVVGSGAGGFELIMAMRHALPDEVAECHWLVRGQRALKGRPEKVSELAMNAAKRAGVLVHTDFDVVEVAQNQLMARDARTLQLDEIIWCAAAKAPDWPAQAGFSVDSRGFVLTNAHLQSVSHEFVFATGDIGTQQTTPSAKAGVFAVRQAPVLFQNIRRFLLGTALKTYEPQTDFLSLMATGGKSAIGNRGAITMEAAWVWRWKNVIDQKFMDQFRNLPPMSISPIKKLRSVNVVPQALIAQSSMSAEEAANLAMRCRGCGGKVGGAILDAVLRDLDIVEVPGVLAGLDIAGDAAIIETDVNSTETVTQLVQSVDQLSAVCDDPYVFGRIAAVHALSDIVAAGAIPHSAQVIVSLPFADQRLVKRDLEHLMSGVVHALNAENCAVVGGHTAEGAELTLGLVVNGFMRHSAVFANDGVGMIMPGSHIIQTKPVGTGVLMAGMMKQATAGSNVQHVLQQMQISNRAAADVFHAHAARAVTDITGFGLAGHLHRLLTRFNVGAEVRLPAISVYEGALNLARQGIHSTLFKQNRQVLQHFTGIDAIGEPCQNLLCDPQTSGGLLGIVPKARSDAALASLHEKGCESACIIGTIRESSGIHITG